MSKPKEEIFVHKIIRNKLFLFERIKTKQTKTEQDLFKVQKITQEVLPKNGLALFS